MGAKVIGPLRRAALLEILRRRAQECGRRAEQSPPDRLIGRWVSADRHVPRTSRELSRIEAEANARWPLQASLIVHRYGALKPGDNIVLVVTASEHRDAAFYAAKFLMDYLKTSAPFWKRESGPGGSHWVEASQSDTQAAARWRKTKHAAE